MKPIKEYVKHKKENLSMIFKGYQLAVIQIGDDEASNSYIRGKFKDCDELGIQHCLYKFGYNTDFNAVKNLILYLNEQEIVRGIILQLPLGNLDEKQVIELQGYIKPIKDIDGLTINSPFNPCTPKGVMDYLRDCNYDFIGKDVVVIGRSNIVGKPLARMLEERGATVTLCHSQTRDISKYTCHADLVFTCINLIGWYDDPTMFTGTKMIIDVGLGKKDGKLIGNLDPALVDISRAFGTTVISGIGGVGLLTRLALLQNFADSCMHAKPKDKNGGKSND